MCYLNIFMFRNRYIPQLKL